MKKLGFVTSEEDPNLIDDDRLAFPYLEKLGFSVAPLVWDRPESLNPNAFDALVFRSCWNYHRKFPEFMGWLNHLKTLEIPVLNPVELIEWNLNKKHLLELAKVVSVPNTRWIPSKTPFSTRTLEQAFEAWNTDRIIVKPAVSLNGHDTYLVHHDGMDEIEPIILNLLEDRDILLQEFVPEIQTEGETSLVFFNRDFSHAVKKIPAKGEFRVHREYGGSRHSITASREALAYGRKLLESIPVELLYARVDIVETDKGPLLIELEVTDPMLYLHTYPSAPESFANAVARALPHVLQ